VEGGDHEVGVAGGRRRQRLADDGAALLAGVRQVGDPGFVRRGGELRPVVGERDAGDVEPSTATRAGCRASARSRPAPARAMPAASRLTSVSTSAGSWKSSRWLFASEQ
jgi:hypothetical protein